MGTLVVLTCRCVPGFSMGTASQKCWDSRKLGITAQTTYFLGFSFEFLYNLALCLIITNFYIGTLCKHPKQSLIGKISAVSLGFGDRPGLQAGVFSWRDASRFSYDGQSFLLARLGTTKPVPTSPGPCQHWIPESGHPYFPSGWLFAQR